MRRLHFKLTLEPGLEAVVRLAQLHRIVAAGKPAGFLSADQTFVAEVAEAGGSFLAVGIDSVLMRRAAVALRQSWD